MTKTLREKADWRLAYKTGYEAGWRSRDRSEAPDGGTIDAPPPYRCESCWYEGLGSYHRCESGWVGTPNE